MGFTKKSFSLIRLVIPCFILLFASCSDDGELLVQKESQPESRQEANKNPKPQEPVKQADTTTQADTTNQDGNFKSSPLFASEQKSDSASQNTDEKPREEQEKHSYSDADEEVKKPVKHTIDIGKNWTKIYEKQEVWIDLKNKAVMIGGTVCLNAGPLEMFICPEGSKEHESVISANALASHLHGALVPLGIEPGKPSSWDPVYRPVSGPVIKIKLMWRDPDSSKIMTQDASQWVQDAKTKKAMKHQWVFGGSEFWTDPDTKEQVYYADSGEMVCLSNFSTACIDVNVQSTDTDGGLLYQAFTENIPPVGTKVYMVFTAGKMVALPAAKKEDKKDAAGTGAGQDAAKKEEQKDQQGAEQPADKTDNSTKQTTTTTEESKNSESDK